MTYRMWVGLVFTGAFLLSSDWSPSAPACCPVQPRGKLVVNADQTVIIIWDAATKTQHFIRKASFKSEADGFGFLVPTPSQPDLQESGNEAFPYLQKLTEPEIKKVRRPSSIGCSCGAEPVSRVAAPAGAKVLLEKEVAGFKAVVLEAKSANDLVNWLKENDYVYSPEVREWAKPYVDAGWKITAMKVAKDKDGKEKKSVSASALRMSFKTDRPLFPYREPDYKRAADDLGAGKRLLRIYFVAEARYRGELTDEVPWTGAVAWADRLRPEDRKKTLELLNLRDTTGPAEWWLTEYEDNWPYRVAPADVYFAREPAQIPVKREPIIQYVASPWPTDVTIYAIAAAVVLPPLVRRFARRRTNEPR
jgi:hypothetical protein